MGRLRRTACGLVAALVAGSALAAIGHFDRAHAFGEAPKPAIDCRKKENKSHPDCKNPANPGSGRSADATYSAAYVLAQRGDYARAKSVLLSFGETSDPRILNYLGFTTRKLGDPEGALAYYRAALEIRADYAMARSYMGEALLALGQVDDARRELAQIERICGTTCDAYVALADKLPAAG